MRLAPFVIWTAAALLASPCRAEPVEGLPQQLQLDRASQQELWYLQQPSDDPQAAPSLDQRQARERLYRQQRVEQQMLQERQRRQLLLEHQRDSIRNVPPEQRRLDAIQRQRQFQLEQQRQLQRFAPWQPPLGR